MEKKKLFPVDDIPEALRDTPDPDHQPGSQRIFLIGGVASLGAIALLAGGWWMWQGRQATSAANQNTPAQIQLIPAPGSSNSAPGNQDTLLLNHFPYAEAPRGELEPIVTDGSLKMRRTAAQQFKAMVAEAQADGVSLMPISAFRSVEDQQHLFFDVKAERGEVARKRAEVSAPPGYSEHHTGYAVDVGDGDAPATNLSPNFEQTAAFKWLQANAAHYSFEISFPKNNTQGVSYEPWHWRYVGDRASLETFYKAKQQAGTSASSQKPQ